MKHAMYEDKREKKKSDDWGEVRVRGKKNQQKKDDST